MRLPKRQFSINRKNEFPKLPRKLEAAFRTRRGDTRKPFSRYTRHQSPKVTPASKPGPQASVNLSGQPMIVRSDVSCITTALPTKSNRAGVGTAYCCEECVALARSSVRTRTCFRFVAPTRKLSTLGTGVTGFHRRSADLGLELDGVEVVVFALRIPASSVRSVFLCKPAVLLRWCLRKNSITSAVCIEHRLFKNRASRSRNVALNSSPVSSHFRRLE